MSYNSTVFLLSHIHNFEKGGEIIRYYSPDKLNYYLISKIYKSDKWCCGYCTERYGVEYLPVDDDIENVFGSSIKALGWCVNHWVKTNNQE